MAELADAQDLGSCEAIRKGSTPFTRTKKEKHEFPTNGSSCFFVLEKCTTFVASIKFSFSFCIKTRYFIHLFQIKIL